MMFSSGFIHHKGRFFIKNENIQKLNYPCLNTMVFSVLFRRPDFRVWHTGSGFSWSRYLKIVWAPEEYQMMRIRIAEKNTNFVNNDEPVRQNNIGFNLMGQQWIITNACGIQNHNINREEVLWWSCVHSM